MTKLCTDCANYRYQKPLSGWFPGPCVIEHLCLAAHSPVDGHIEYREAGAMRRNGYVVNPCGPDATLFKPKTTTELSRKK